MNVNNYVVTGDIYKQFVKICSAPKVTQAAHRPQQRIVFTELPVKW